jgi:formylglycine-generating enzyme required for sulfatase activity/FKBP-type peptidyl-prolyl cis-trans isomerase
MLTIPPTNYVWIPPGRFTMGSPLAEQQQVNSEGWLNAATVTEVEGPQTEVTLTKGFYMSKYFVTQGEYLALMGVNPSHFAGDLNCPVEACGWFNATNYCGKLTAREQKAGRLPTSWSYRLPTEAEWEYACRAGTTTRFSYGDDPGYAKLPNYGWYDGNSYTSNKPPGIFYFVQGRYFATRPVGQKLPNPWGLYDMHGLLSEWCQDWFGPLSGGSVTDPQGPATGTERVIRNGSWLDDAYTLRSAMRYSTEPEGAGGIYGFRAALGPNPPVKQTQVATIPPPKRKIILKDEKEDFSYGLGAALGNRIRRGNIDLNLEMLIQAIRDAAAGKPLRMNEQQAMAAEKAFAVESRVKTEEKAAALLEKNEKEGEAFLAANKKRAGIKTQTYLLELGKTAEAQYEVIREGTGPLPGTNDMVTVNYRGTLLNGKEFDSSAKRGPKPAKFFILYGVKGWRDALPMMKVGSKWKVYLPSDLAYGDKGDPSGLVEPGSALIFEIELIGTEPRRTRR